MKIRRGFVSNSSSSSFICDICQQMDEMFDDDWDYLVIKCENHHAFCTSHLRDYLNQDPKAFIKKMSEIIKSKDIIIPEDESDIIDLLRKNNIDTSNLPKELCPACQKVMVTKDDLINYIIKKTGKTYEEWENQYKEDDDES